MSEPVMHGNLLNVRLIGEQDSQFPVGRIQAHGLQKFCDGGIETLPETALHHPNTEPSVTTEVVQVNGMVEVRLDVFPCTLGNLNIAFGLAYGRSDFP